MFYGDSMTLHWMLHCLSEPINIYKMPNNQNNPQSHFFVEINSSNPLVQAAADSFGPLGTTTTEKENKYRVTSRFTFGTGKLKAFAVAKGHLFVVPQSGDNTRVNVLLRPMEDTKVGPKVKYFVYRGILKENIIAAGASANLIPKSDPAATTFLNRIWDEFIEFNNLSTSTSLTFPAKELGYDPADPNTVKIDAKLFKKGTNSTISYNLPLVKKGEHFGFFQDNLGFEIVLDYGDFDQAGPDDGFVFDLVYARASDCILNVSGTANGTNIAGDMPAATSEKVYRESIYQFADPAAFYGTHVEKGKVTYNAPASSGQPLPVYSTSETIYTNIVSKFLNKNRVYIYLIGERGRSYNFYNTLTGTPIEVGEDTPGTAIPFQTNKWPVLFDEDSETEAGTTTDEKQQNTLSLRLRFGDVTKRGVLYNLWGKHTDKKIKGRFIHEDLLWQMATPPATSLTRDLNFAYRNTYKLPAANTATTQPNVANLIFLHYNDTAAGNSDYRAQFGPINLKPIFEPDDFASGKMTQWVSYTRPKLLPYDKMLPRLGAGLYQMKVVFDGVAANAGASPPVTESRRRLYILKSIDSTDDNYKDTDQLTAGYASINDARSYHKNIYGKESFKVWKGKITDGAVNIDTLHLRNDEIENGAERFLQLGITEEEYNKLVYNSATVPPAPSFIPAGATNLYFVLEDVTGSSLTNPFYKYQLKVRYDDASGTQAVTSPSSGMEVFVYTVTGLYFFSKDYSALQQYTETFANSVVEFRTRITDGTTPYYNGEFGFDWMHESDNTDSTIPSSAGPTDMFYYLDINGGYEVPAGTDTNDAYESFEAYTGLKKEYERIPTLRTNGEEYFVPWLTVSPPAAPGTTNPPPSTVELRVLVQIDTAVHKLEFDYDRTLFTIDKPLLQDKAVTSKQQSIDKRIKISCLRAFNQDKHINILAYPTSTTTKAQAKIAGKIIVRKNSPANRKRMKIVLVNVITDINGDGTIETGAITAAEKQHLRNTLWQAYIDATIEVGPDLDLKNDPDFKITTTPTTTYGQFIFEKAVDEGNYPSPAAPTPSTITVDMGLLDDHPAFYPTLQTRFFNDPAHPTNTRFQTGNYFTIFCFNGISYFDGTLGKVHDIDKRNVALFTLPGITRPDGVMSHEVLHGLGLFHTFETIITPAVKYNFSVNSSMIDKTENVMSYDRRQIRTFKWQWDLIRKKL